MFQPDELVWAKVRGYPWWPGRVKNLKDVPKELAESSRQNYRKETVYPVFFFGSHDYALITDDSLKPLEEEWDGLSAKSHGGKFRQAITEAKILLGKAEPALDLVDADESLPTNAFIEVDPETGQQTLRKRRGRPPKKRPDDLPTVQYTKRTAKKKKTAPVAEKSSSAAEKPKVLKLKRMISLRKKLQKILLRPDLKPAETPIAKAIVRLVFGYGRCTQALLVASSMGLVLAEAMKRRSVWAGHPEYREIFKTVLGRWKSLS